MPAHVLVLTVDLRLPECRSLKVKRAAIKPMTEGARRRFSVAAAETDRHDDHNRAELAFACVGGSSRHVVDVIDNVERFVWSFPEAEVLSCTRRWLEVDT